MTSQRTKEAREEQVKEKGRVIDCELNRRKEESINKRLSSKKRSANSKFKCLLNSRYTLITVILLTFLYRNIKLHSLLYTSHAQAYIEIQFKEAQYDFALE